jgi:hypothetical protein
MKNYIKHRQLQENELPPVINPFFSDKIKKIVNVPRTNKNQDNLKPSGQKIGDSIAQKNTKDKDYLLH